MKTAIAGGLPSFWGVLARFPIATEAIRNTAASISVIGTRRLLPLP
jgi:hypothetical protein